MNYNNDYFNIMDCFQNLTITSFEIKCHRRMINGLGGCDCIGYHVILETSDWCHIEDIYKVGFQDHAKVVRRLQFS